MNPDRSTYTSTNPSNPSIRPRNNRRLISYDDEDGSTLQAAGSSTSSSPFPSRRVSPIPGAHPSRPLFSAANTGSAAPSNHHPGGNGRGLTNASSGLGLWESWSSIQSIASTLLGSDPQTTKGKGGGGSHTSVRRKSGNPSGVGLTTPQWGPETSTGQTYIAGSKEERQAMVQAKKRETLLLADTNGLSSLHPPHKRRDSNLRLSDSASPAEHDGDALVYVHKVKPQDTLAGVMIRYQCQPAVFRKVNRLWPNDNIQIRDHVFLPVEACAIRGRRIDISDSVAEHDISTCAAPDQPKKNSSNHFHLPTDDTSPSITPNTNSDLEPEYKHEYFVSLPNIPESIAIARIPRRTLGFFPPSRRKSQTLSDIDPYSDTPKTSLDMTSRFNSLSVSTSPSRNRPNRPQRSNSKSNSSSYWADRLKGPGGVGTLRSSGPGGVVGPGPAEDSLNKMFAHHLPNVAPRESFDSVRSTASSATAGLENVGGVIEGWVRKVGSKITGTLEPDEVYRRLAAGAGGAGGAGEMGIGDLIELEDSGETSEHREGEGDGAVFGQHGVAGVSGVSAFDGSGSERNSRDLLNRRGKDTGSTGISSVTEEEALLRERFPPRGKMVDAQTNLCSRRR